MSYHLISDNYFFLYGADELLHKHYGVRTVVFTSLIKSQNELQLFKMINKKGCKKAILCVSNVLMRRRIMRLLGKTGAEVLILSHCNFFRKNLSHVWGASVSVIPTRSSKETFIAYTKIAGTNSAYYMPSRTELDVIKTLCRGVSVPSLSARLGKSSKTVYNIKNNVLERTGGLTGTHGLLLCRDIFEMSSQPSW